MRLTTRALAAALGWVLPALAATAAAQERGSRFIDPEDGQFDLSYFLENPRGFLPIPIVVTEPAVASCDQERTMRCSSRVRPTMGATCFARS